MLHGAEVPDRPSACLVDAGTVFELVHQDGFFYVRGDPNGHGVSNLLLDMNTPMLLSKSSVSGSKRRVAAAASHIGLLEVITDLGTRTLTIDESWKRNVTIYNDRTHSTYAINFVDVARYSLHAKEWASGREVTCRSGILSPPLVDWTEQAGGIFGLGLPGNRIGKNTLAESLQFTSYGLSLEPTSPHIDINAFNGLEWLLHQAQSPLPVKSSGETR